MIRGSTGRQNVDLLGIGERGDVTPEILRLVNQVLPLFSAEHAMQQVMREGVRHGFESRGRLSENAVMMRTHGCFRAVAPPGLGVISHVTQHSALGSSSARLWRPLRGLAVKA